jgi:hypothetical protein
MCHKTVTMIAATGGVGQDGQWSHPSPCSQISLADCRGKLASDRRFHRRAGRVQNHVFSDTAGTWDSTGKAIYSVACASLATALGRNAQWMARK